MSTDQEKDELNMLRLDNEILRREIDKLRTEQRSALRADIARGLLPPIEDPDA
jgi:cell division protein FtsB